MIIELQHLISHKNLSKRVIDDYRHQQVTQGHCLPCSVYGTATYESTDQSPARKKELLALKVYRVYQIKCGS